MAEEITSPMLKSAMLAANSQDFPMMVRAAAQREGVPFTRELVEAVATDPDVVDAIHIYDEHSIDAWIRATGPALDDLLLAAVAAHQPASGDEG